MELIETVRMDSEKHGELWISTKTLADLRAMSVLSREQDWQILEAGVEAVRTARLRTAHPRPAAGAKARKSAQ